MDYYDALIAIVPREEARAEIRKHNAEWEEFLCIHGDEDEYEGADVLAFLGY